LLAEAVQIAELHGYRSKAAAATALRADDGV
jgi:hypothetical protein